MDLQHPRGQLHLDYLPNDLLSARSLTLEPYETITAFLRAVPSSALETAPV
jgi:hypothetical protein